MILITGHVTLTPEHRERMIALGGEHSARSRSEAGCLAHHCHVDVEDAMRLTFVEEWESMAAVRAHFAVPASGAFVAPPVAFDAGCMAGAMFTHMTAHSYHVHAREERFEQVNGVWWRSNQIWRRVVDRRTGNDVGDELLKRNRARVMYDPTVSYPDRTPGGRF